MKKIGLLILFVLALMLCACNDAGEKPTVITPTFNSKVESVSPMEENGSHTLEKRHDGVSKVEVESRQQKRLSDNETVTLCYQNGETDITQELTEEESATIISFLTARRERKNVSTDAFREEICFEISGYRFEISTDQSRVIKNCATGMYISLSEDKWQMLCDICEKYGAVFPCD